ncbi:MULTISPECIES: DUF2087 domain-containing protein [Streptomyces]|uniref:DUF2087 domain-containing protein n=2 Tax=Streptomyces TaxID=1883 RepID=A0ABT9LE03_STRGD|nr:MULTISPECIES: DUF2087 domain-containing protein [Streptomyces]MDP9681853.1 hypothetical protein [Streptomyces griseoviridis]GGS71616.1 hypothetical protein GCM10010240_00330 [Streptomyces griseoviridis]GGU33212.1 hypothetical protein GCM10010259_24540 [Streptomyces daghestanicus]GHI34162.1 hypothetical protein Sdagh_58920 [Streptomyces daghestanicus]
MTTETGDPSSPLPRLAALLADEGRVRAFAAVALGAGSAERVAATAGLSPKETAAALRRLRDGGVVAFDGDGALTVAHDRLREAARTDRPAPAAAVDGDARTDGAAKADLVVRTFVRDGRLLRLPARWTRKKLVLRHIAERTFEPGVEYPERVVDEKLRAWCEEGDVDHVTLRRHLVDLDHLRRSGGVYRRPHPARDTRTA